MATTAHCPWERGRFGPLACAHRTKQKHNLNTKHFFTNNVEVLLVCWGFMSTRITKLHLTFKPVVDLPMRMRQLLTGMAPCSSSLPHTSLLYKMTLLRRPGPRKEKASIRPRIPWGLTEVFTPGFPSTSPSAHRLQHFISGTYPGCPFPDHGPWSDTRDVFFSIILLAPDSNIEEKICLLRISAREGARTAQLLPACTSTGVLHDSCGGPANLRRARTEADAASASLRTSAMLFVEKKNPFVRSWRSENRCHVHHHCVFDCICQRSSRSAFPFSDIQLPSSRA